MPPIKSLDVAPSALSVAAGEAITLTTTPVQANGRSSSAAVGFTVVAGTATIVKKSGQVAEVRGEGEVEVKATCGAATASLTLSFRAASTPVPPPPVVEPVPVPPVVTPTPAPAPTPVPVPASAALEMFAAPVRTTAEDAALPAALRTVAAQFDALFMQYGDSLWARHGASWDGEYGNYYDRTRTLYAMWKRTGRAEYLDRARAMAVDYRTRYIEANNYGPSAYWSQMWGLYTHWIDTGDAKSATAVVRVAEMFTGYLPAYDTPTGDSDLRTLARRIQATLLAWKITKGGTWYPPNTSPRDFAKELERLLALVVAWEKPATLPAGPFPSQNWCNMTGNYMLAMLLTALIEVHTFYRQDAAFVATVKRSADWLWSTQWKPATVNGEGGFLYLQGECPNVGGASVAGDITGMYVSAWGWLARMTGDAKYVTQGDAIFRGTVAGMAPYGKQFNETTSMPPFYLGWRP